MGLDGRKITLTHRTSVNGTSTASGTELTIGTDCTESDAQKILAANRGTLDSGTQVESGAVVRQTVTTPIPAGANVVTVSPPAGFVAADLESFWVEGPAGVEVSNSITVDSDIDVTVTAPPEAAGTHDLVAKFVRIP